jgi:hypothetical protein
MKKSTFYFFMLIVISMISVFSIFIEAQTTIQPTGNVYVKGGTASDSNYYADPSYLLRVRGSASDDNKRRTYLKFDLHSFTGTFSKAELRITINRVVAIAGGLINRADLFTVVNDNWNEATITWNSAPPRVNYLFTQEFLPKVSTAPDTVYIMDVTSYVQSEFAGDKIVSLCMVDTLNNGTDIRFWSNRSLLATGPELVLSSGPVATVNITSPIGGENWLVGSTHNITWSSSNVSDIKIDYSTNNGTSWIPVIASTPAGTGSYSWTIPNSPSSNQCKVRVSDAAGSSVNSASPNVFTIINNTSSSISVDSPNGGEHLYVGSIATIKWLSTDVSNVKIEYTTNNGGNWNTIISSIPATRGSYSWLVPNTASNLCKVRISDVVNPTISSSSSNTFSISSAATSSILPSGNVYVKGGTAADSNYVTDNYLRVRGSLTIDTQRKTYLKFNLQSFTGSIDKAELKVTAYQVVSITGGLTNRSDIFTVSDDSWNESSITWNNAPARNNYLLTQEFASKQTTQPDTTYTMDITSYVNSEFAGDKILSLCMVDTSNNGTDARFGSTRGFVQAPQIVIYSATDIEEELNSYPNDFRILQNYPNPFNPETIVLFSLPSNGLVDISIFDALGQKIKSLYSGEQSSGNHKMLWNGTNEFDREVSSGVYLARITFGGLSKSIKMLLAR